MSFYSYGRSTHVNLHGVSYPSGFEALLRRFANTIRRDLLANDNHRLWAMFRCIAAELKEQPESKAIDLMLNEMENYFDEEELEFDADGMALTVVSDMTDCNHCSEFVDALAIFLVPYCSDPYLSILSTYHDGISAGTEENILYRSGDQILKASTDTLIERLFSDPAAMVTVLQSTPSVGRPVQQMLRATA